MFSILSSDSLILHGASTSEPASLPREFAGRKIADVWSVINECAVRISGPIDRHSANRLDPGADWQQYGDRLSCYLKTSTEVDLLVVFERPAACRSS